MDQKKTILHGDLFAGLSEQEAAAFLDMCDAVQRDAGALIIEQGEPVNDMHVFADGKVSVSVRARTRTREVAVLEGPAIVGEIEFLTGRKASASATTLAEITTYTISREPLDAKIRAGDVPTLKFLFNLSKTVAKRLEAMNERMQHYLANPSSMRTEQLDEFRENLVKNWTF